MGGAIKFILYGLFGIFNEGENAQQGCGCLTIIVLFLFGGFYITKFKSHAICYYSTCLTFRQWELSGNTFGDD